MGLAITVGSLADLAEFDPEGLKEARKGFKRINKALAKHKLPKHNEPDSMPGLDSRCQLDSLPYTWIHYLRRAFAHRVTDADWIAAPLPDGASPAEDPLIDEVIEKQQSHLINHSDAGGYYVPIDFERVIIDDRIPEMGLGSTHRLREELLLVAPALNITLTDATLRDAEADAINADLDTETGPWIERIVWLALWEAARLSIKHKTAILFA